MLNSVLIMTQKELLSPPRAIQTSEELQLLLAVYRHHGKIKEALEILNSPNLGISSSVGKSDWSLVLGKLNLLEEAGLWQEKWDYCKMLLESALSRNSGATNGTKEESVASQGDDWRLWTGLINSSQILDNLAWVPPLCSHVGLTCLLQKQASYGELDL